MSAIAFTLLTIPAAQAGSSGAAVGGVLSSAATEGNARMLTRVAGVVAGASTTRATGFVAATSVRPRSERCRSARVGLAWYRQRFVRHIEERNRHLALLGRRVGVEWPPGRKPRSCADARHLAVDVWPERAAQARAETNRVARWIDRVVLAETPYDGRRDPWPANVREVQGVFPGSEGWILSCSDAEGWEPGLTYWATHGWGRYYRGFEDLYIVGGPGQFKWPTFIGMYRRGLEHLTAKGYRVPTHLRDPGEVRAWLSPLAQAIAMGAAYSLGLRGSHWSASHGSGC